MMRVFGSGRRFYFLSERRYWPSACHFVLTGLQCFHNRNKALKLFLRAAFWSMSHYPFELQLPRKFLGTTGLCSIERGKGCFPDQTLIKKLPFIFSNLHSLKKKKRTTFSEVMLSNRKLWKVLLKINLSRTSCLARKQYGATCVTVILVTDRLEILKREKSFFITLTMFLLSTLSCRYVVSFSFGLKFAFILLENCMSFHTIFIKLETRVDKKLRFSLWLFTPMKKLIVISSS